MSSSKDFLLNALSGVEDKFDKARFLLKRNLGALGPFAILPYYGYGNHETVHIMGRLLEDEGLDQPEEDDPVWKNLYTMFKRYESDEITNARLRASFQGQTKEITKDSEGYFEVVFNTNEKLPENQIWHSIDFELLDQIIEDQGEVKSTGEVMVPGERAQFGVISDVDDTILVSKSSDLIQKGKLTFLKNAKTRMPFEGVAAFYRALQKGSDGNRFNPIFYVSSSPWNLYDLLVRFCENNDIPKGPFLLRDMGLTKDKFIKSGHMNHKVEKVERIFRMYPDLSFILVGDSGQKDAEIYQKVVNDYPDKVLAIYIRDVSPEEKTGRDGKVKKIAQTVKIHGIDMLLCQDTEDAAHHAIQKGYIPGDALSKVVQGRDEDHQREE
jgi:phosphatidate phosphatase APP1